MSNPIDLRKSLFDNIVVIGGTGRARNFRERLIFEISKYLQENTKIVPGNVRLKYVFMLNIKKII